MPQFRGYLDLSVLSSTPASPASGYVRLYGKSTDNRVYAVDSSGRDHQVGHPGDFTPEDHGLVSWSFPYEAASGSHGTVGGTVYLVGQQVPRVATVTTLYWANQALATLTGGQCWAALLNSSGTVLQTVDISSKTAAGLQSATITATQVTPGFYWIGLLFNGLLIPALTRAANAEAGGLNVNRTAATARYASNGTSQTSITNRTPASNTVIASAIWAAMG